MTHPASLAIEGELTIYRASELRDALQAALSATADTVDFTIDLAAVTEMDSAGVQLLMAARKTALSTGRRLRLIDPSPAVAEVLDTLQLGSHFAAPSAS